MKALKLLSIKRLTSTNNFFILLTALFYLSSFVSAQTAKPDFSGKWKINIEKSSQAYYDNAAKEIAIEQNGNDFTFNFTYENEGRDTVFTVNYLVDGKTIETSDEYGQVKSYNKWSEDGKSVIIFYEYIDYVDEYYYEYEETEFKIADDKKSLFFTTNRDYSTTITIVYDRVNN